MVWVWWVLKVFFLGGVKNCMKFNCFFFQKKLYSLEGYRAFSNKTSKGVAPPLRRTSYRNCLGRKSFKPTIKT